MPGVNVPFLAINLKKNEKEREKMHTKNVFIGSSIMPISFPGCVLKIFLHYSTVSLSRAQVIQLHLY